MKPVFQNILHQEGVRMGNCLQAAVASLFDCDIDSVPPFQEWYAPFGEEEDGKWHEPFLCFIDSQDAEYLGFCENLSDMEKYSGIDGYFIASGISPRGTLHATIYRAGKMVHDPHPSREGLSEFKYFHIIEKKSEKQKS